MKPFSILLCFILLGCSSRDFRKSQTLENLADKDTLLIQACIHHHCGGEWGGCLERHLIYRQGNNYFVKRVTGLTVWNGDTIIDAKKMNTFTEELTKSDQKAINDFLSQVSLFSDSLSLTSNGPNYYSVKTRDYFKQIVRDYDQWPHFQRLMDNLYK